MKRNARTHRLLAGGAALAMSLGLAACGSGDDNGGGSGSGTFKVLVYGDATNKVEKQIVATFNKTSKVKAVLQTIPGANYQQKLQTIINTKQAPDVFFNWGGGSIVPFVKAGLLEPLDSMIQKDPNLKSKFLPSVFNSANVDGKSYGVPMRGTQPVMLFYNKKVLSEAGVTPPKTWDDLLGAVDKLKAKGKTPIALGGADQWPTLMWYEYLYDRVAGPDLFKKALDGDKGQWDSAGSKKALTMLKGLEKSGAFGNKYDSVKFTDNASPALLSSGKAGFELMGSWYYSTQQDQAPDFAKKDLGWVTFPTVDGGTGDAADLVGNTNNFYSVMKKAPHKDAIAKFLKLQYSDEFVKAQMAIGNLPTTTTTEGFLDTAANPTYSKFQFDLVKAAPAFQLSWDQAYPQTAATPMHKAVQQYLDGKLDQGGFIKAMQNLPTS